MNYQIFIKSNNNEKLLGTVNKQHWNLENKPSLHENNTFYQLNQGDTSFKWEWLETERTKGTLFYLVIKEGRKTVKEYKY